MASDLLSTLKSYLSKVADGEHTPAELASTLNTWIKESTESIKLKVEDEVQRSVAKMGFIKRAEFDEIKRELRALRAELERQRPARSPHARSSKKATTVKSKATVKTQTKSATKKVARKSAPTSLSKPRKGIAKEGGR